MNEKDRNRLSLWRKFDATDKQPLAKGTGLVGENDYQIQGSMWPSKKGENAKGPWQVWSISLQPAQGETRKLVAVPPELLGKVLELIGASPSGAGSIPTPASSDGGSPSVEEDDIPF